jgi:hypothetical protein
MCRFPLRLQSRGGPEANRTMPNAVQES